MCASAVRFLRRLDRLNRVSWVPAQGLDSPPSGLTWSDLDRSAYLETPTGDLYEGFFATRELLLKLPATAPVGAMMMLPGVRYGRSPRLSLGRPQPLPAIRLQNTHRIKTRTWTNRPLAPLLLIPYPLLLTFPL